MYSHEDTGLSFEALCRAARTITRKTFQ